MEEFMILTDENGNKKKCEIIALFQKNNNNYIAYTEEDDKNIPKDLLVSKFQKNGSSINLISIDTDEEWEIVEQYLENELYTGGEDDDALLNIS